MHPWGESQRRQAKDLFGRALRLALAEWVVERAGERFYQREAQDAMRERLSESGSGVVKELAVLVRYDLLHRESDGHRVYYTMRPSPIWDALSMAASAIDNPQRPAQVDPTRV